ncbi:MAG: efflux RND transporter periplasmic adaptor subunit [Clostridia bacterium]|nr:efflux RND transporter periplasmic adaptor subunit [Clostridia bacterium]
MKLKRIAVRGLIILCVVVAACMFFARTVVTITTPKVQLVTASQGKLEQKLQFRANLVFPETVEIQVPEAEKLHVTIEKVKVKPGQKVEKGDVIYTCLLPSYEEDMKKLQETYEAKNKELLDLDVENKGASKSSRQNDLYNEMIHAQEAMNEKTNAARKIAMDAGITLYGRVSGWQKQLNATGEIPAEVQKAVDETEAASQTYEEAYEAFFAILEDRKLKVSTETFRYIRSRDELLETMDEITGQMVELSLQSEKLKSITADHAGYVTDVPLQPGDPYDGAKAAYTMTKEETGPQLRVPLDTGMDRTIADGTKAEITISESQKEKTTVEKTEVGKDGSRYLLLEIPESLLKGSASGLQTVLQGGGCDVSITYKAKSNTTLLPPSAVRNEGENQNYVYLVERNYGGFMSSGGLKVVKTSVTVLDRSDRAVSISEDLSHQQIADREDRALSDGQTVMEYVQ